MTGKQYEVLENEVLVCPIYFVDAELLCERHVFGVIKKIVAIVEDLFHRENIGIIKRTPMKSITSPFRTFTA